MSVAALRYRAQLLSGAPAGSVVDVVDRLLAVQAQDLRAARLAVRARSHGLTAADVDTALNDDRSVVVGWLNRGTLHLVRSEDYGWLHRLVTPPLRTGNARRLAQEGVPAEDVERGVAAVVGALDRDGPLTRDELRERVSSAGVRTEGQALVHLLFAAALRGLVVRGPMRGRHHAWVLATDWLPATPARDRSGDLEELARRYLAGHGPADDRDLAKWTGLPLRDTRAALAGLGRELVTREDGLLQLRDGSAGGTPELPAPRLLGAFEPALLGWASRGFVVGDDEHRLVAGGLFRPFALVDGSAAATWRLDGAAFRVEPFRPLPDEVTAALRADARDVARFLA